MLNPEKTKTYAIAKLKNGESPENIGVELGISPVIVKEWEENLLPEERMAKQINAIAIQKAGKLLSVDEHVGAEKLQLILLNMAITITDEVKVGFRDHELAKAINVSADTIAKLQNAFFDKGTQIAVMNNNNINNSPDELKVFRGTLRS